MLQEQPISALNSDITSVMDQKKTWIRAVGRSKIQGEHKEFARNIGSPAKIGLTDL